MFPGWTDSEIIIYVLLDTCERDCFLPQIFEGIRCLHFSGSLLLWLGNRTQSLLGLWGKSLKFSHLPGSWQRYLLSEVWRLVCHVFSQSPNGSQPTCLVFCLFVLHKIAYFFTSDGGVRHFGDVCPFHMHTICGLLASWAGSQIGQGTLGQLAGRSSLRWSLASHNLGCSARRKSHTWVLWAQVLEC